MAKIFESQINLKSLGVRKPDSLNEVAKTKQPKRSSQFINME
jgi:hypothetical protein